MGYLLMFARSMQITARKNQLNYEMMSIQCRKTDITNQLAMLKMSADYINEQEKDSPGLKFLELHKQMLTQLSSQLDARLKTIQTEVMALQNEEKSASEALQGQIQAATPKYVGM